MRHRTHASSWLRAAAFLAVAACGYVPPPETAPRAEMALPVSFGKTWDAVVDFFAQDNIPIRTIERSSGLIMAERASIPHGTGAQQNFALSLANCGKLTGVELPYYPTVGTYNVVVRGDSTQSTVRVTATYRSLELNQPERPCSSSGKLESDLESFIRDRATRR